MPSARIEIPAAVGQRTRTGSSCRTATRIRVPVTRVKGLTDAHDRRDCSPRANAARSLRWPTFFRRVEPAAGGNGGDDSRRRRSTNSARRARASSGRRSICIKTFGSKHQSPKSRLADCRRLRLERVLPGIPLCANRRAANGCEAETELFGFAVSGHPLELFPDVAWDTYCPVNRLGEFVGETVTTCGLVVEQRTHHQITGEPMKFLTLADWTGMVETELFAQTYKSYGLATVRYPVLEVRRRVEPFENGRGFSLARAAGGQTAVQSNSALTPITAPIGSG